MRANTRIEFANTLRGLAALFVVISHYLSTFWYKRDSVAYMINAPILSIEHYATPTFIQWFNPFPLFDWGAYGVALFFIISGFVIPFSLQQTTSFGFCINRFFRIVPTYVVGFSITLCALYWGMNYFSVPWPYTFQELFIHYAPGVRDLLDSRNIDVIIWTLEIEMKFYLIAALSIGWLHRYSLKVFLIPVALFILIIYMTFMLPEWSKNNFSAFICARICMVSSQYLIFMFIGVFFHYVYLRQISLDKGYLGISALFAVFCIAWWTGPESNNLVMAWSYAFALLTFLFAYTFPRLFSENTLVNFFANISYPLYVIHSIAGYVVLRVMLDSGYKIGVALLVVLLGSLFFSFIIHKVIEVPSQKIGKKVSSALLNPLLLHRKHEITET
ncbi:MAG: acyltransferase family protein [Legionella sp.]